MRPTELARQLRSDAATFARDLLVRAMDRPGDRDDASDE